MSRTASATNCSNGPPYTWNEATQTYDHDWLSKTIGGGEGDSLLPPFLPGEKTHPSGDSVTVTWCMNCGWRPTT